MDIDRKGFEWRDIERVYRWYLVVRLSLPLCEVDQARQEACQRLSCACGGDEERALIPAGCLDQGKLMRTRAPATRGEPVFKLVGKEYAGCAICHDENIA